MSIDNKGLFIRANLGGTDEGKRLYQEIKGGYTDKMSFGFYCCRRYKQSVEDYENNYETITRTITKISKLFDVSAVSIPANDMTSISARKFGDEVIAELKAERLKRAKLKLKIKLMEDKKMNLEEIKTISIDGVEKRMKEIRSLNLDECENIDNARQKVDALEERKRILKAEADKKKELRAKIATGKVETRTIEKPKGEERKMELTKDNYLSSKEYRSAFIKNLMKTIEVEERGAIALSGVEVIPTELQDKF